MPFILLTQLFSKSQQNSAKPRRGTGTAGLPARPSSLRDATGRYERAAFSLLNNYRNRAVGECDPIDMMGESWDLFAGHYAGYCERFEPDFSAFEARHTEQAIRLALVFHAWEHVEFPSGSPAIPSGHKIPMSAATARAGLMMFEWFAAHQGAMLG